MNVFRAILESSCLSVRVSVCPSVYKNSSFCQNADLGIKSHLVAAKTSSSGKGLNEMLISSESFDKLRVITLEQRECEHCSSYGLANQTNLSLWPPNFVITIIIYEKKHRSLI